MHCYNVITNTICSPHKFIFSWQEKKKKLKILSNYLFLCVVYDFKQCRKWDLFLRIPAFKKIPSGSQTCLGERQTSQQAGGGLGAARVREAYTDQRCRRCFSGCQESSFCPLLMQEATGSSRREDPCWLCLSWLHMHIYANICIYALYAYIKLICLWCFCLQEVCSLLEALGAMFLWDGTPLLVPGGLLQYWICCVLGIWEQL